MEPSTGGVDQSASSSIGEFARDEVSVAPLLSASLTVVDDAYTESPLSMTFL